MGLDGGSIPLRIELCKTKQKEEVADKAATRANRFFTCALSGLPLVAPIAMCATGRLYTYENVLTTLLAKPRRELVPELAHLRSKHDVFLIKPTRNPEYTRPATDPVDPDPVSPWTCPVTGKDIGKTPERFVAARGCGCVVAHSLLALAPDSQSCFNCGAATVGFVELIPSDEIAEEISRRLEEERAARKSEGKKSKKERKTKKSELRGNEEKEKGEKEKEEEKEEEKGAKPGETKKRKTATAVVAPSLAERAAQKAEEKTARVSSLFSAEGFKVKTNRDLFYNITAKK